MAEKFTKGAARNIYYGGSLFFILLFLALTLHTTRAAPETSHAENLTESVARGKLVWEENNCIGCHTLLGEGAYYAPELGNVYVRRGGDASFKDYFAAWMKIQPLPAPGRRKMPQFNLTDQQVDDLAEFLKWTSQIDTQDWPPNVEG
ncbi:nitric oxide reductase, NorC subunit apoprotein [Microbulbifer donghaiensis]|uniref:Nitric oxide reductase, NorC subunit apoprotein n=1 Tax=Microbulbifer donghaiensis TaxID=494016 RepID=A0A1M5DZX2_9GAMM|nr:cytochrome c [Microbulbifer donghaiensis]SHF72543.1 nitric oxide reductase, NorC subunit apoprotein [Microbulbifer donghaiensis]